MRKEAFVLAALLAIAAGGQAETPSYTIKLKPYPSKGKSIAVKVSDQLESTVIVKDESGKELRKQTHAATLRETYSQTTLEATDGKLVSFQREYALSRLEAGEDKKPSPWNGKTVTFTLKDRGCVPELKDGKLSAEDTARLAEAHTDGLALLHRLMPDRAVKEGDEWPLTGKQIVSGMRALPIDPERSRGKGKLVSVTKKDGVPIGKMELELDLVAADGAEGGGKFVVLVETALDGSSTKATLTLKGTLTLKTMAKMGGKKVQVQSAAAGELTARISEEN